MKRWTLRILTAAALLAVLPGCNHRIAVSEEAQVCSTQSQYYNQAVDLLFVIDNSLSMEDNQKNLVDNFPKLIEALRSPNLGPDGSGKPCTESDRSGCQLPDLHVGVVSTNLGIAPYRIGGCESPDGDGARLQNRPRKGSCAAPSDPWISFTAGKTNIPGEGGDPVQKVKQAFSCIARLGVNGCGFEQPLETARMALDPAQDVNPGFLRNSSGGSRDALLAVVIISDEDDCSASNRALYDPLYLLYPPCSGCIFRCFAHGITCDVNGDTPGPRKDCKPDSSGKWLYAVDRYVDFFKGLKRTPDGKPDPSRVIMATIAGPARPVSVEQRVGGIPQQKAPNLLPSCEGARGKATPGIRLEAVAHAFARPVLDSEIKQGVPHFVDDKGVKREENVTSICNSDYSPALQRLGRSIVASLRTICLKQPRLTSTGGVACRKGDVLGKDPVSGQPITCEKSCLDQADLQVQQESSSGQTTVERCPTALFDPAISQQDCGASCPCWRIVPSSTCQKTSYSSPYALEVMRAKPQPEDGRLKICSVSSLYAWGSSELARLPQCK